MLCLGLRRGAPCCGLCLRAFLNAKPNHGTHRFEMTATPFKCARKAEKDNCSAKCIDRAVLPHEERVDEGVQIRRGWDPSVVGCLFTLHGCCAAGDETTNPIVHFRCFCPTSSQTSHT